MAPDIRLSGTGDEAAPSLGRQIEAITRLGWGGVELRSVDGIPLADLTPSAFDGVAGRIAHAGLSVTCVDSRIGNWARTIRSPFGDDLDELDTLAERCARLDTRLVRIMSCPNAGLPDGDREREVLDRVRRLKHAPARRLVGLDRRLHRRVRGVRAAPGAADRHPHPRT